MKINKEKNRVTNIICLELCDGDDGRCQLYPRLVTSCSWFTKYRTGYDKGYQDAKIAAK